MLPQRFSKKSSQGIPLPVLVIGGVLAFMLLVFVGVAITMGSPPAQTPLVVDLTVE